MLRTTALALACCMLPMLPGGVARAASIEVAPVVIDLQPGQQSTVITLTNRSGEPTAAQLRVFGWRQSATGEELLPTEEVLVSPPVFQLAPGAAQVARLVLRPSSDPGERTFRILVDELPPPLAAASGVRLALRLSLPVFVPSAAAAPPSLAWRISPDGKLTVTNSGRRHERLTDLRLVAADGSDIPLQSPTTPYVLGGAERQWTLLRRANLGAPLRLTGRTSAGAFQETVRPASR
jgi:fimbrial chaperone protein